MWLFGKHHGGKWEFIATGTGVGFSDSSLTVSLENISLKFKFFAQLIVGTGFVHCLERLRKT